MRKHLVDEAPRLGGTLEVTVHEGIVQAENPARARRLVHHQVGEFEMLDLHDRRLVSVHGHIKRPDHRAVGMSAHSFPQRPAIRPGPIATLDEMDGAQAIEICDAAAIVLAGLVRDQNDIEGFAQYTHEPGSASRTSMQRRKHGKRRDQEHARPRLGSCGGASAQPIAE